MPKITGIDLVYCEVNGEEVGQIRVLTDDGGYLIFYEQPKKGLHWFQAFGMMRQRLEDAHAVFVEEKPHAHRREVGG